LREEFEKVTKKQEDIHSGTVTVIRAWECVGEASFGKCL
jgi:hypothetical protein